MICASRSAKTSRAAAAGEALDVRPPSGSARRASRRARRGHLLLQRHQRPLPTSASPAAIATRPLTSCTSDGAARSALFRERFFETSPPPPCRRAAGFWSVSRLPVRDRDDRARRDDLGVAVDDEAPADAGVHGADAVESCAAAATATTTTAAATTAQRRLRRRRRGDDDRGDDEDEEFAQSRAIWAREPRLRFASTRLAFSGPRSAAMPSAKEQVDRREALPTMRSGKSNAAKEQGKAHYELYKATLQECKDTRASQSARRPGDPHARLLPGRRGRRIYQKGLARIPPEGAARHRQTAAAARCCRPRTRAALSAARPPSTTRRSSGRRAATTRRRAAADEQTAPSYRPGVAGGAAKAGRRRRRRISRVQRARFSTARRAAPPPAPAPAPPPATHRTSE